MVSKACGPGRGCWALLALFGRGDLEAGYQIASELMASGIDLAVVVSEEAERTLDPRLLKGALGCQVIPGDPEKVLAAGWGTLAGAVIPAWTTTALAKLSQLIGDTPASAAILRLLLEGKPLLAADTILGLEAGITPPEVSAQCRSYLNRIRSYGIKLSPQFRLARAALERFAGRGPGAGSLLPPAPYRRRAVITEEFVRQALGSGSPVRVPKGSVITPLARDSARDWGLQIVEEDNGPV